MRIAQPVADQPVRQHLGDTHPLVALLIAKANEVTVGVPAKRPPLGILEAVESVYLTLSNAPADHTLSLQSAELRGNRANA